MALFRHRRKVRHVMVMQSRPQRILHLLEQITSATLFAAIVVLSVAAALVA